MCLYLLAPRRRDRRRLCADHRVEPYVCRCCCLHSARSLLDLFCLFHCRRSAVTVSPTWPGRRNWKRVHALGGKNLTVSRRATRQPCTCRHACTSPAKPLSPAVFRPCAACRSAVSWPWNSTRWRTLVRRAGETKVGPFSHPWRSWTLLLPAAWKTLPPTSFVASPSLLGHFVAHLLARPKNLDGSSSTHVHTCIERRKVLPLARRVQSRTVHTHVLA
jgi:hypothetical protein